MNPKKLLMIGATGGTGQQLVTQALDAGHEVTAFVRASTKIPVQDGRLRPVVGTVTDGGTRLTEAMRGHDAVISALGRGTSLQFDRAPSTERSNDPLNVDALVRSHWHPPRR